MRRAHEQVVERAFAVDHGGRVGEIAPIERGVAHVEHRPAEERRDVPREGAARVGVGAVEPHRHPPVDGLDGRGDLGGERRLGCRQRGDRSVCLGESVAPAGPETRDPVQHGLVDAQRSRRELVARPEPYETAGAQRAVGRERVPVRVREHREREGERRRADAALRVRAPPPRSSRRVRPRR